MTTNNCELLVELIGDEFIITCACALPARAGLQASLGPVWTNASLAKALKDVDCQIGPPPYYAVRESRRWRLRALPPQEPPPQEPTPSQS